MNALVSAAVMLCGWQASVAGPSQSLVLLTDQRPVLLRLQLHIDGQPAEVAWKAYLKRWFVYLDRDRDGMLNTAELIHLPKPQAFSNVARGGYYLPSPGQGTTMSDLGKGVHEKATLNDVFRYYVRSNLTGLDVIQNTANAGLTTPASTALFKALDTDKDGFLSRAELEKAATVLQRFDSDDDEMVGQNELTGATTDQFGRVVLPGGGGVMGAPGARGNNPFFIVPRYGSKAQLTAILLARYDKDGDTLLTRLEVGLEKAEFRKLDTNQDNKLDIEELEGWLDVAPATVVRVQLGRVSGMELREAGLLQPPTGKPNFAAASMGLQTDDAQVTMHLVPSYQALRVTPKQYYFQFFNQFGTKDVITQDDLQGQQQRFQGGLFAVADRNTDGKLTRKEVEDFGDLVGAAYDHSAGIRISEEGRVLFQMLDSNRDGKLSRREMLTAWERLVPLDRNSDQKLSPEEIARQYTVAINRGSVNQAGGVVVNPLGQPVRGVPVAARGPTWFQKMDTTGDGEVSRREWLGTPELFRQIDTNNDGQIELDEAEAFDRKVRQGQGR